MKKEIKEETKKEMKKEMKKETKKETKKEIKKSKSKSSTKLIIDSNLLARKSFYQFRNLSVKAKLGDVEFISKHLSSLIISDEKDSLEIDEFVARNSGKKLKLKKNNKIEGKLRELTNKNKEVTVRTGVLYGMLRSLLSTLEKFPDISEVIFCYDPPPATEVSGDPVIPMRIIEYPEYKVRPKDPETEREFYDGFFLATNFLYKAGFLQIRTKTFEADDLLHFFTHRIYPNDKCIVLTNDHDLKQVINNSTSLLEIGKNFGLTTKQDFIKQYGIPPFKYREVLALSGCSTDSVPGIPGIGEDTAIKLIKNYGSLKNLLNSIESGKTEDIPTRALTALLKDKTEGYKALRLSRKLVSLYGTSSNFEGDLVMTKINKSSDNSAKFVEIALKSLKFRSILNEKPLNMLKTAIFNQKGLEKTIKDKISSK